MSLPCSDGDRNHKTELHAMTSCSNLDQMRSIDIAWNERHWDIALATLVDRNVVFRLQNIWDIRFDLLSL